MFINYSNSTMADYIQDQNGPFLRIIEQPVKHVRFRYESDKGSHGGISGRKTKTYPTVKLENYNGNGNVFIQATVFTNEENPVKHIFELTGRNCKDGAYCEAMSSAKAAEFKSLAIRKKTKSEIRKEVTEKKRRKNSCISKAELAWSNTETFKNSNLMHSVKLCFEAFTNISSTPLCPPVFSEPIYDKKSSLHGDLHISRISHSSGSSEGNQEIILLCNKIDKDQIKIRFYETDEKNMVIWEGEGKFSAADVHHQVAIAFWTPPYKNTNGNGAKVFIELMRPIDGETSNCVTFTYICALNDTMSKKRKYNPLVNDSEMWSANLSPTEKMFCESESCKLNDDPPSSNVSEDLLGNQEDDLDIFESFDDFFLAQSSLPEIEVEPRNMEDFLEFLQNGKTDSLNPVETDAIAYGQPFETSCSEYFAGKPMNWASGKTEEGARRPDVEALPESYCPMKEEIVESVLTSRGSSFNMGKVSTLVGFLKMLAILHLSNGNVLLHLAVILSKESKFLVEIVLGLSKKAINRKNFRGHTPLQLAALYNKITIFKFLLSKGADVFSRDTEWNTVFHIVAKKNRPECLLYLLLHTKNKLPPDDMWNKEGLTPLHLAVIHGSNECVRLLLKYGWDCNIRDQKASRTPLHLAVQLQPSTVPLLLEHPFILVDVEDFKGHTPLQFAYLENSTNVIKQLLKTAADPGALCSEIEKKIEDLHLDTDCIKNVNISNRKSPDPNDINSDKNTRLYAMLDPPNDGWKQLGKYLGFDENVLNGIQLLSSSPAAKVIEKYWKINKSKDKLIQALELVGFVEAESLLK